MDKKCWAQLDPTTCWAKRIFRNKKAAAIFQATEEGTAAVVQYVDRAKAVGQIRLQVFQRAGFKCEMCGCPVRWERGFPNSGEMDEKQARGECLEQSDGNYKSGEQSVANGQCLCKDCHRIKTDREPQFSKGEVCTVKSIN